MSSPTSRRRPWTHTEDELLKSLISIYGHKRGRPSESRWTQISSHLPGRSNGDCRKRWFHSLDPSLRKGRWTKDEDRIILDAYQQLGPSWKQIALLLDGRKDDQVAKRYKDILSPNVRDRLSNWTSAEDKYLADQVTKYGHRWSAISKGLPGRPPLTCRNRWRYLSRSSQSAASQPESEDVEAPIASNIGPVSMTADDFCDLSLSITSPSEMFSASDCGWVVDEQTSYADNDTFNLDFPATVNLELDDLSSQPLGGLLSHEIPRSDMSTDVTDSHFQPSMALPMETGSSSSLPSSQGHSAIFTGFAHQVPPSQTLNPPTYTGTEQLTLEQSYIDPAVPHVTHLVHHHHHHHYHIYHHKS
ncbi:hypothetical protein ABEF92_000100 [Exophiala dermatitidis]|uniref:Myb-like DNA-binding protein BAS1 n=1 Tax=Exophiala dermatitidis (strain ATCC 34100 / CBS 525.76 / NIH/UT8656) TaxID=858893 RepID=H6BK50_EXODN|nr:myb-like DNA-binding protein BAS1 [Exophiala dermatitidis NIH/UT8656]EHY53313.1 myb-like DNA-binding protein BAS1 [Exophiala dermatitidis NIH/UT8656]